MRAHRAVLAFVLAVGALTAQASAELAPVTNGDWHLKIVNFSVGQADAALIISRDGKAIAIECAFVTHYDSDHIVDLREETGCAKADHAQSTRR